MWTPRQKLVAVLAVVSCLLFLGAVTVINLATQVTGLLATANGGTGVNSTATFPSSGTVMITTTNVSCSQYPALTGNVTSSAGSCATTIASAVVTNAMLASGAYIKGEYHAFCTGLTLTTATTNFDFAGFGGIATACATSNTSAVGGTKMPTAGTVKNLFVNLGTAGKSGDKVTMLKNGSSTGAPTCTYATATSCSNTSTALSVAAGDIITISITTSSSSETSANVAVSFELWN